MASKSWTNTAGGVWATDANWSPAGAATAVDAVTITGPAGSAYQTITGPGNSASLALLGNTVLSGAFNTGALAIGSATAAGALNLAAGTTLNATAATLLNGPLLASGTATRLAVNGALTLGGARTGYSFTSNTLTISAGASVQAASVVLAPSTYSSLGTSYSAGADSIGVDSTSSLEVGSAGNAAAGKLTIDAGATLGGTGSIAASAIVDQGTIIAQGGLLSVSGAVSGAGTLQVGAGATLSLGSYGAVSSAAVSFTGAGGTLDVGGVSTASAVNGAIVNSYSLNEQGTITGFVQGDTLGYAGLYGVTPTAAIYQAGTGSLGTLTLMSGTTSLGSLTLAGNYATYSFQLSPVANSTTAFTINLVAAPPPAPADPLFDAAYYLLHNPDVAAAGVDPYTHYMTVGWKEGRNPSALFNTNYYLNQNPDVRAAGVNPLTHFENNGWKEGRDPSTVFSDSLYLAANPDVRAAGIDPLLHYVNNGKAEGRLAFAATPHATGPQDPLVDAAYVYAHNPAVAAAGLDASAWYNSVGWQQGANPDACFDTNYYLAQNPDVKAAGVDPLTHFETNGWKEGRQPSLVFSDSTYLKANPDVAAAGFDPLLHYVAFGQTEGRMAFLPGGTATADPLVNAAYYDAQLGATLVPAGAAGAQQAAYAYDHGGWQAGLNPDALFNTAYYLSHNPDVAAAHVDPLLHYETYGWKEGRNPSALFDTNAYLAANPDVKAAAFDPLLHYVGFGMNEGRAIYAAPA